MFRSMLIGLSCVVLLGLVGCEQPSSEVAKDSSQQPAKRVLLVMKSLVNPFYTAMEQGAREAAEQRGVELIVRSGTNETRVEQQIEIIDEQLAAGIDAIVIAPADSIEIIPALARAYAKGVHIVNIDNQIDPTALQAAALAPIPFVSVDNQAGGFLAGQYLASKLSAPAKALIIEGPRSANNAIQRRDGAHQALRESGRVEVVASEEAHWRLEQAYALVKQVHAEHPDLQLVFAANDMMALGAVLYAQEHQLSHWLIGGYDNIPDAQAAITSGWLKVTIDQQAHHQGYLGLSTVVDLIEGKPVEELVLVDVRVMTQ